MSIFFLCLANKSSALMRHDPASTCPINECSFMMCVCGGYLDVSNFPPAETLYVGHCPAFAAVGPALNVP